MRKRITCALLSFMILVSTFHVYSIPAQASAYSPTMLDAESTAELLALLWAVLSTGAISSGAYDGIGDLESSRPLQYQFELELAKTGLSGDRVVTLSDGTQLTGNQLLLLEEFAYGIVGSAALGWDMTDEEEEAYRQRVRESLTVINGGWGVDPDDDDDDDDNIIPFQFSKVKQVVLGSGFMTAMGDFFKDLINGDIPGINPGDYFDIGDNEDYVFTGDLPADHHYLCKLRHNPYVYYGRYTYLDQYINDDCFGWYAWNGGYKYFTLCYFDSDGYVRDAWGGGGWYTPEEFECFANFPWFDGDCISIDDVKTALENGDFSQASNYKPQIYDFPNLADALLETLHPLTGIMLNSNAFPMLAPCAAGAAQSAVSAARVAPAQSTRENNRIYSNSITDAINQILPQIVVQPDPAPEPAPEPAVEPAADLDPDLTGVDPEVADYAVHLNMIFPFCLPFDFIYLVQALKAEPETPVFEIPLKFDVVKPIAGSDSVANGSQEIDMQTTIDLHWMDGVMEIFRLGELGCWIILLIILTHKVIRW